MPNRIIKESTFTSDRIASLTDFEFRLWIGLITQADDAGRGDARPAIIKGRVFALRDRVTVKDISSALCALAAAGCVSLYTVGGKPYYEFPSWTKHQRIRDCKSRYPGPDEADDGIAQFAQPAQQSAAICGELPQNAALIQSNPIQSESESESEHAQASAQVNAQDAFAQFWNAYPNHKDKKRAESAFAKAIRKVDLETMLAAIDAQKRTDGWIKENGRFIPMPSTWLNGERWNDDAKPDQKAYWRTGRFAQTRPEQPYEKDDLEMAERLFAGKEQQ